MELDTDWCAFCGKRATEGRLYCSEACADADAGRAEAPKFNPKDSAHVLNDFVEANERKLNGPSASEPIPRLSELRKKKGKGAAQQRLHDNPAAHQVNAAAIAPPAPLHISEVDLTRREQKEVDQSREFLRAYQRRRTWVTPNNGGPETPTSARSTGPTSPASDADTSEPAGTDGSRRSDGSGSWTSPRLAYAKAGIDPPPFMSMSTSVTSTELDPAIFKKPEASPGYAYGVDRRRYQRDMAYVDKLMKESWYTGGTE